MQMKRYRFGLYKGHANLELGIFLWLNENEKMKDCFSSALFVSFWLFICLIYLISLTFQTLILSRVYVMNDVRETCVLHWNHDIRFCVQLCRYYCSKNIAYVYMFHKLIGRFLVCFLWIKIIFIVWLFPLPKMY